MSEIEPPVIPEEPMVAITADVSGFYEGKIRPVPLLDPSAKAVSRSAYAITLVGGLQAGWFGPLLPSIAQSQHLPLEQIGILVSAVCAGCLSALAASRPIIARLGDLKTTLMAAFLIALGFVSLGSINGLSSLAAGAFCYGLGSGLNSIASHIFFPRYYPDSVASALSRLNVFFGIGALIGPIIALTLLTMKAGYNWIFIGAGLYALVLCSYLLKAGKYGQIEAVKQGGDLTHKLQSNAVKKCITHPVLITLALINFLYVGIETTLGAWTYTFLQRVESLDGTVASAAVSLLWAGLTLGRIISTRACLKFNPKYVTMAAMLILVSTIFLAATVHMGAALALPVVLTIGIGMGPIFPTVVAQSATRFPSASSATTTIVIGSGNFGGMLLPWLAGYAIAAYGAINFMLLTGLFALLLPVLLGLALFSVWKQPRLPEEIR